MQTFSDVIKDASVSDVHAGGILGADKKKKKQQDKFQAELKITKIDEEHQYVGGWATVCSLDGELIVDKQDDIIEPAEIEKAAWDFVLYSRDQGDMHQKRGVGRLVESLVFTEEKAKAGIVAKNEEGKQILGWFVGFKISDPEIWKLYKAGRRPEFSIGGRAKRD